MKPDKHFLGAVGIVLAAALLIALTWIGTLGAIDAQRTENTARVRAALANQALTFTEQINRQILAMDQTLRILVTVWETNPRRFDLEAWRTQAAVLNGLSRDMVLTDENGIVRQSSVSEAINQNVANLDYFRGLARLGEQSDAMFIGAATIDPIMRQWHMNAARSLRYPDGSFAGAIDADYRIGAITDVFSQTDLGTGALIALVGLGDGKLRAAVGPATIDPDVSIADTPMFAAVSAGAQGLWTGPSANDAVRRIHAFRHIPERNLAIVVAMDEIQALRPATEWRQQAEIFAGCITALLAFFALAMVQGTRLSRRREAAMAEDRATLAAANAQLQVARALADAKAEQLEATLAGMSDGVSMVDGHMCLVEWNARFPEIAGLPPEILRVGLPMEELLRAQIRTGQFGHIPDPEAEVERRMARLRVAPFGVVQRQRPDGHTIELRRNRLPDGGFVTLYADITEHKRAEEALRRAQTEAEAANAAKSRFVAIVSHEIRTPLNALLNTVRLLSDSVLSPAQRSLLALAGQSGDVLFGLISDILDISQMEAGKLAIRPSLFELRPLLESCADLFATQAAEKGIRVQVEIADGTPETLLTDPGRLRQVLLNLVSNAIKYARRGNVLLTAEPGGNPDIAVRVSVKDAGPAIDADSRQRLFRPFSRLERPDQAELVGTGLGLSICQQLMALIGGEIGCDVWSPEPGREGNVFWTTLPATALPFRSAQPAPLPGSPASFSRTNAPVDWPSGRPVPRTRVLLAEDVPANQLVTATLLRREGHCVDIASSGQEAVEAVRSRPYDLVFMDIFMPGMSGPEATRIIRGLPRPACATPIIALTANVSAEDEAVFKAAGMDGLLGKPVSLAELLKALREHVWSGAPVANDTNEQADDPPLIDNAVALSVERIEELKGNLPPATLVALVEECLRDLDHQIPALRRALANGATGAIVAHAHTMVGSAAGYGLIGLENRLRAIMTAVRQGDIDSLDRSVMDDVENEFMQSSRMLREIIYAETAE